MRDKNFIGSLAKGITVLELLGSAPEPMTLTDVAREMDTNKTSAQRFINTLLKLGYIIRVEHKRYCLGNKVLRLAQQFLDRDSLATVATPILANLSKEMDRSVSLSVLDGSDALMVFRKERARFHPFAIHAGSKVSSHCTTVGKILLAALPDDELKTLIEEMELVPITPKTIVNKAKLLKAILQIRKQGFAIGDQEFSLDLYSVGVPILDRSGSVVAAASISLNMHDKQKTKTVKQAKDKLIEAGLHISRGLGYEGDYPSITVPD